MGHVNSQGLTWLEWRDAAGYADDNFSGHDGGILFSILRDDWKSGIDPALHVIVKADERSEPTQMYADEDMFPPGA
jgi:hypothetical protein